MTAFAGPDTHPSMKRRIFGPSSLSLSLVLSLAVGCTGEVLIGVAAGTGGSPGTGAGTGNSVGTGAGTGNSAGTGGDCAGAATGTGTVTVTSTITVLGCCGNSTVSCNFSGSSCDCTVITCTQVKLEARCDLASTGMSPCTCFLADKPVGSCSQPPFPPDVYEGCGDTGFGCCAQFFPITH